MSSSTSDRIMIGHAHCSHTSASILIQETVSNGRTLFHSLFPGKRQLMSLAASPSNRRTSAHALDGMGHLGPQVEGSYPRQGSLPRIHQIG